MSALFEKLHSDYMISDYTIGSLNKWVDEIEDDEQDNASETLISQGLNFHENIACNHTGSMKTKSVTFSHVDEFFEIPNRRSLSANSKTSRVLRFSIEADIIRIPNLHHLRKISKNICTWFKGSKVWPYCFGLYYFTICICCSISSKIILLPKIS